MNADKLSAFDSEVEAYAALSRPPLNSVLVLHRGVVVSEHYWRGFSPTSYQPIFSVTKSVVSALIGIALADGKLTLSDTLAQWFPDAEFAPGADTASVTIEHLLTMSAGFERLAGRIESSDTVSVLLKRKSAYTPGEQFQYSNEDIDLLVIILERALGECASDFSYRRLFAPLGIWHDVPKSGRKRLWKVDKQGHTKGSHGLHLTTPELALFGRLYLQAGSWQGEQLVPLNYVAASTKAHISGSYPEFLKYGYLWWITTDRTGSPAFFASGRGGQFIYVVPTLDLVVVITSAATNADGRPHRVMLTRLASNLVAEGL